MKILAIALSLIASTSAFAHGTSVDMTGASISVALSQLKVDHPEHVAHFQGVKGWPEGDLINVKIYLPDNATVVYVCQHDESAPQEAKCTMKM